MAASTSTTLQQFPQPSRVDPPPGVNPNQAAISLMAMAETFRSARRYKMAIKCCHTALRVPCSIELYALCSYELGKLYWLYTRNEEQAQFHLSQSLNQMRQLGPSLEQARLKTASLLAELLLINREYAACLDVLKAELADSPKWPSIHTKLLFIYAEAQLRIGEFARALEAVQAGVQFSKNAGAGGVLVECYFRLVKSLILSIQMTDQQELGKSVGELGEILQTVASNDQDQVAINDIRAFCYAIQLCYFLAIGMVKSSKQCLHQLHITVQAAETAAKGNNENSSSTPTPMPSTSAIRWLTPELLTGFAYVLTVLCNIQYSNFERANRYLGTALKHLGGMRALMAKSSWPVVEHRTELFMTRMEMLLHEGAAQMQMVIGNPREALTSIVSLCQTIRHSRHPSQLLQDFGPQLHTLLGLYAVNMREPEAAEHQFKMAMKGTNEPELWTLANLSLALVYLFAGREANFYDLFDAISPAKLRAQASSVRAAAHLVHGFHYFLHSRQQESKKQLMDSITISKEEDMARLQSIALLLLAKLLRSRDVLKAAREWAGKSGDSGLLLWANSESLALGGNNPAEEMHRISEEIGAQRERMERIRLGSAQMAGHNLIQWIDGDIPAELIA